jgi:2-phosphosulfolactate phosphatase
MSKSFIIDCFAQSRKVYPKDYAVIAIDVIRATTTATTALYQGRTIYPAANADEAIFLAESLTDPLLVGEMGGHVPYGFHLTNSPVQIMALTSVPSGYFTNVGRPLILVSSSGIPLILSAKDNTGTYLSCLRNFKAVAKYVSTRHDKIAILGAGTRGNFRIEDQIGCAWVAEQLLNYGFTPENTETSAIVERWSGCSTEEIRGGDSANYLKRSGQVHDLEFILHHVDDLNVVPIYRGRHFEDALRLKE